jgi:homoserine O-succinyltransferase
MALVLLRPESDSRSHRETGHSSASASTRAALADAANVIEIGLINNMPDSAIEGTERQYANLLNAAAGALPVRLRFFSLPEIERAPHAQQSIDDGYFRIDELWTSSLDAIIVTGAEPKEPDLRREPYWSSLTQLMRWAESDTVSSIWSCLAAHAAVLHFDGINRFPLPDKCCGVFQHQTASTHLLTQNVAAQHPMPHSRWNEIRRTDLMASAYEILTESPAVGVNLFAKQAPSLFLFWQGHPEYDERSLLKEYQRDIGRFLRKERSTYPTLPHGYFDPATVESLENFERRARDEPSEELISKVPLGTPRVANTWRTAATQIYGNWLRFIAAEKQKSVPRPT